MLVNCEHPVCILPAENFQRNLAWPACKDVIVFVCLSGCHKSGQLKRTRTWANAQRDDRPAEYRWRALFNAAKFGWCPLLECRTVTLPRRESRLNLQGCPKLANRSQPLGRRSSPYYEDMWGRYQCLTSFFRLSIYASAAKIQPDKVVRWCQNGDFLRPVFSTSRLQHISDMHSKFAIRPHHVRKYGRHPISDRWD